MGMTDMAGRESKRGWIGVDLDGTLAMHDGYVSWDHIGEPIPLMVERVMEWIKAGDDVRIFTARAGPPYPDGVTEEMVVQNIQDWCFAHIGRVLPVTNKKDFQMIALWDDRCTQVQANTGRIRGGWVGGLDSDGHYHG